MMGAKWAAAAIGLAVIVAGCGPRAGSDATLESEPHIWADGVVDSTTIYQDEATAKARGGLDPIRDDARYDMVDSGTLVRVISIRGDLAVVRIKEGEHKGRIVWVRSDDLKAK
jgi:hypothetical protein